MDKEKHQLTGFIGLAVLVLFAWIGFHFDGKPGPGPATPADDAFSLARATEHVVRLASEPHSTGTAANRRVRDYLLQTATDLGLEVDVQKQAVTVPAAKQIVLVENVVARMKGTTSAQTLMLAAHYDTVYHCPGAGDDGAAVAALLETMRALKAGPQPRNDIIFLFTDAEELLLLGARAFVEHHPWAAEIDLVMNFEGRGNAGPVQMFQTSPGNGNLIRAYAAVSPAPVASSLADEVYKFMPNQTDFTLFRNIPGVQGLNFAHIGGPAYYHSAADRADLLDRGSLRHHGIQALALARYFGDNPIPAPGGPNRIFFNVPGLGLITYGPTLALVIGLLCLVGFILVIVFGRRAGLVSFGGLAGGFGVMLACCIVAMLATTVLWNLLAIIQHPVVSMMTGHPYRSETYFYGLFLAALAAAFWMASIFCKKLKIGNFAAGAALLWLLLALGTTFVLPGASYLFALPLLFLLIGLAIVFKKGTWPAARGALVLSLCSIPLLLIYLALLPGLYLAVPLGLAAVTGLLTALAAAFLFVSFAWVVETRRGQWSLIIGFIGWLVLVGIGMVNSRGNHDHPKISSILYLSDRDSGDNHWVSLAPGPDPWTVTFLTGNVSFKPQPLLFPAWAQPLCEAPAPAHDALAEPTAEVLQDTTEGDRRNLRLRLRSPRGGHFLGCYPDDPTLISDLIVAGQSLDERYSRFTLYGMDEEGIEISFSVPAGKEPALRLMDMTIGLPDNPVWPEDRIPANFLPFENSTLVSKTLRFPLGESAVEAPAP